MSAVVAGVQEEYGSDMPSASIADAIVLAVYIPPQAPGPGQDVWTTASAGRKWPRERPRERPPKLTLDPARACGHGG